MRLKSRGLLRESEIMPIFAEIIDCSVYETLAFLDLPSWHGFRDSGAAVDGGAAAAERVAGGLRHGE